MPPDGDPANPESFNLGPSILKPLPYSLKPKPMKWFLALLNQDPPHVSSCLGPAKDTGGMPSSRSATTF